MAQLTVTINGRRYNVACQDGQEDHLQNLAAIINEKLGAFGKNGANMSEAQLLVMGSLTLADELYDSRQKQMAGAASTEDAARLDGDHDPWTASDQAVTGSALQKTSAQEVELFAEALSTCTEKLEHIVARLEKD